MSKTQRLSNGRFIKRVREETPPPPPTQEAAPRSGSVTDDEQTNEALTVQKRQEEMESLRAALIMDNIIQESEIGLRAALPTRRPPRKSTASVPEPAAVDEAVSSDAPFADYGFVPGTLTQLQNDFYSHPTDQATNKRSRIQEPITGDKRLSTPPEVSVAAPPESANQRLAKANAYRQLQRLPAALLRSHLALARAGVPADARPFAAIVSHAAEVAMRTLVADFQNLLEAEGY